MKQVCTVLLLLSFFVLAAPKWHSTFYADGGGYWRGRLPIVIANKGEDAEGDPVSLDIEKGSPLIGELLGRLRVVDDQNRHVKFHVQAPSGLPLDETIPITEKCKLFVPVKAAKDETVTYHVYFGNPKAWLIPERLQGIESGLANGSFEIISRGFPLGWRISETDSQHRITLSTEKPATGKYCIKVETDEGSSRSWFKLLPNNIPVTGGTRCTIRVKVRGENTGGQAGWFAHVSTKSQNMAINKSVSAPENTFDWTEISMTIDLPEDATSIRTGTMLTKAGATAWYDDFAFEMEGVPELDMIAHFGNPEYQVVKEQGRMPLNQWNGNYDYRIPIRLTNSLDSDLNNVLASISQSELRNKSAKRASLQYNGVEIPTFVIGNNIFFRASIPAKTVAVFYLYTNDRQQDEIDQVKISHKLGSDIPSDQILVESGNAADGIRRFAELLDSPANMVANPSFEEAHDNGLPRAWSWGGEKSDAGSVTSGLVSPGGFGKKHAFMSVPKGAKKDWIGWRQQIPVTPGKSYVYGAWFKAEDLDTRATVHIHMHNEDKTVPKDGYGSAPSPTLDDIHAGWTPVFGNITLGADTRFISLHLTMNGTGTLRHDGAFLAETVNAHAELMESKPIPKNQVAIWQTDTVVKTFQEDPAPKQASGSIQATVVADTKGKLSSLTGQFDVKLARNETEPLQLAIRAGSAVKNVTASVTGLENTGISCEIGVVAYVPVDSRGGYFHTRADDWVLLFPRNSHGTDGWAGMWPDPIKPVNTFDLLENTTQPIWFSFKTDKDTKSAIYDAKIKLAGDGLNIELPIKIQVWNFTLPEELKFAAVYDYRSSSRYDAIGKHTDIKDFFKIMREKKMCPNSVAASPVFKKDEDGNVTVDFTSYDKAAEFYFDEMGFPVSYTPGFFYAFGWAYPLKSIFGEKPFEGDYPWDKGESRRQLRPEYKKLYQQALRKYMDHMREKGWDKKVTLYISDEPHFRNKFVVEQMQAICEAIKEVEPDLPIYSSTWRHCEDWDGYLSHWGVAHYGAFPEEIMRKRLEAGDLFWFTTDGQMSLDTPLCAIERLLPHYCCKYGATAYEFWGMNWLTYDPWKYGWHAYIRQADSPTQDPYFVRYPNGDGYLFYPGQDFDGKPVTSLRAEASRDGVDDYEYMELLAKSKGGNEVLEKVQTLVQMPSAGGRYSTKFLTEPEKVRLYREMMGTFLSNAGE